MPKADNEVPRLAYPINDFAAAVGIGRTKIYSEIRSGRLKAKRIGSRTIITADAARDYLAQLPDMPAPVADRPSEVVDECALRLRVPRRDRARDARAPRTRRDLNRRE